MPRVWEPLMGDTRGTVTSLAAANPDLVYATTPVGIYHTRDAGHTWRLTGTGTTVAFGESIAANGNHVFAGAPDGLYRSVDAGETWQLAVVGSRVTAVCASEEVILAGTDTDGVVRSADAGRTWSGANAGLLDLDVLAIALSPGFASDGLGFVGTGSGLFRTRNRAESWRIVDIGVDDTAVQCVAVRADRLVVAGTEADGLVCSRDAGATWERPTQLEDRSVTSVAISPRGTIVAATDIGEFISSDGGHYWQLDTSAPGGVLSLVYLDADNLLAATEATGVWRSTDDGASWADASMGLDASLLSMLAMSADQSVWTAGPTEGVRVWRGGIWQECNTGLPDTTVLGLSIAPDESVFVATPQGVYVSAGDGWRLADAGPARAVSAGVCVVAITESVIASDDAGRTWRTLATPFNASNVISLAADGHTLLAATREESDTVVCCARDSRHQWDRLWREPRTREVLPVAVLAGTVFIGVDRQVLRPGHQPTSPFEGSVTAIAAAGRTVWVGTTGGVYVSEDSGETYQLSAGPRRVIAVAATADAACALELGGRVWLSRPGF
jgi:ligand-binding sensor domain-containing protein